MPTNAFVTPGPVLTEGGAVPPDGAVELSVPRLLLRFGVGFAALAGERFVSALRAPDARRAADAAPEPGAPEAPPGLAPRHALIGALVAAPGALSEVAARVVPAARRLERLAGRGRRVLARLPGRDMAARRLEPWRARAVGALGRLAVAGRAEEIEGRALARGAVRTAVRSASAAIADSPEVKRVIEEQSQGLAVSAIAGLRARSARADSVVESAARRLLGRRRAGPSR